MNKREREEAENGSNKKSKLDQSDSDEDLNNSSMSNDSEDQSSEIYEFTGTTDENGNYTGEGILEMKKSGTKYIGFFKDGTMTGQGKLLFPDESYLFGEFNDGSLNGAGVFVSKEGTKMEGNFEDSLMSGPGKEFYPDGKLFFEGEYQDGLREGKGVMHFTDERCRIEGTWAEGVLQGEATYFYPDNSTLKGIWEDGELLSAKFNSVIDPSFNTEIEYVHDESSKKLIAKYPLRRDPYESQYCYAKKSEILPNAGEGLFASRDLPADFIVSLYNGIRISLVNGEKKPWHLKPNLICLNDGMCVDVPVEFSDLTVFQNTIGHKANHHYDNNAKYELYWAHPIYGKIRCIRTIKPVKKDEEIFVDYGYEEGDGPEWYLDFMKGRYKNPTIL